MRKMIDMAREAGMTGLEAGGLFDNFLVFEALVRADEREACAKVCESEWSNTAERMYGQECATAIRARGNT
jgi:hypothetical protein